MKDKVFIDTNIFVYAFLKNKSNRIEFQKNKCARELLKNLSNNNINTISTQVCGEYYSALSKYKIPDKTIQQSLDSILEATKVQAITKNSIIKCLSLKNKYNYSYWDSLILSSALESGSSILYSEDMQNNQIINGHLTIKNPFYEILL
ncbi:MAG: PIN domain nuclease [Gammaproteobacteria bacterium]|nr:MAG: PIN domain nuclease [Gammaproteobacteria bacterium]